ncbi:Tryptophan--tRNA ligase [Rubripirellula amarantea]|uniref:Tryptophan--tRNA ligase n=1 Tax=Rubripirellula amarantea TaxID=2527999 RepID=A0A5C5WQV4_9BACT|nr:tryptophan--tRNA ligase [Rubripirellula amarantea]TWT52840.1 Tryptophan--tRNA ligase [Rubripirellula amarantea]
MRVLSGIQPTGRPHWGNFFGAIRQYIDLQDEHEGFYFIADLHALTTVRDPELLRSYVLDAALDLLALGLDPTKATMFVQSYVPEVSELNWLLLSNASMGLLERCTAFKEKKERGLAANAGLFTYPVLMTADILVYDSQIVPVGADQIQHIEVCRDLASSFNHAYGETFVLPKAKTLDHGAKVPGTDGQKMSKSYDNTLPLFGDVKKIRKQIMRITTDSRAMEDPKDPEDDHLFDLYRLFADQPSIDQMAAMYRRGGFGYGEVKKAVAEASEQYFAGAREKRSDLEKNLDYVHQTLRDGADRAREVAGEVLSRAQKACGVR